MQISWEGLTMVENSQLDGNKFIELGEMFIQLHKTQNLSAVNLDFSEMAVVKEECGTVACHGGWGLVLLCKKKSELQEKDYMEGAHYIARFLGFPFRLSLRNWADENPHMWGNPHGDDMFTCLGHRAFGLSDSESHLCTLVHIGEHYKGVGHRLLALKAKEESDD